MLSGETLHVRASPSDTISVLRARIFHQRGIPTPQQILLLGGMRLVDACLGRTLADYEIEDKAMLTLLVKLRG